MNIFALFYCRADRDNHCSVVFELVGIFSKRKYALNAIPKENKLFPVYTVSRKECLIQLTEIHGCEFIDKQEEGWLIEEIEIDQNL